MKASVELVKKISEQQCEPDWLKRQRVSAFQQYEKLPDPTVKDEMWKYIHPKDFEYENISLNTSPAVFQKPKEAGVIVETMEAALKQYGQLIEPLMKEIRAFEMSKLDLLHEALWQGGMFVYVPARTAVMQPIHSKMNVNAAQLTVFPFTVVVVEKEGSACVIDEMISLEDHSTQQLSNAFRYIWVKEGARLQYVNIDRWNKETSHFETQVARVGENGFFQSINVGLGGYKNKFNIHTIVEGKGAEAYPMGIFLGDGRTHFDVYTVQDHRSENTMSNLLYKSALKDASQFSYQGVITIPKSAQRSDAYQANQNLLLSPMAKARSIPKLEIIADDVRCKHSATMGTIEAEETFYLESRGLSREEAVKIMVEGFFEQVLEKVQSEEVRDTLRNVITEKLQK